MIITIARQCGSGGHEIGKELASRLGLELYDRKKLEEEAKKLGKLDGNRISVSEYKKLVGLKK